MKGTIALDIDGTLIADFQVIPPTVASYLTCLVTEGWRIVFITGRTFASAMQTLKVIAFPFYLAVQNGAIILEMPRRRIVAKKYLDRSIFDTMSEVCEDEPSDFVVYGGFEHGDVCYYRPKKFSTQLLNYLKERIHGFQETWYAVDSYDEMDLAQFPSIKCFGLYPSALELTRKIEERLALHVPLIRDPFNGNYYVVQATHPKINKGQALQDVLALHGELGRVIAAGDDENDRPMLALADIKIVMATASKEMLEEADIIAPPALEEGIISALETATRE